MTNSNRVEHASETWLTDATVFEVTRTPAHSNHKENGASRSYRRPTSTSTKSHSLPKTSMIPLSPAFRFRAICRWQDC